MRVAGFLGNTKRRRETALGGAMALAGAGFDGISTYMTDQAENPEHSQAFSMAKGAAVGAAWLLAEPLMWGITVGGMAKTGAELLYNEAQEQDTLKRELNLQTRQDATGGNHGTIGGQFQDSQQAYTMRQRQMDLLRQHRMSTEAALGSEARQLHR